MSGRGDNLNAAAGEFEFVAIGLRTVEARNRNRFVIGAVNFAAEPVVQSQIGFHMVLMVMSGQDMGEFPAVAVERPQDRPFFRGVYGGRRAAFRIVQEHPEIVAAAKKDVYFQRFHLILSICRPKPAHSPACFPM